ncbi:hypothetical protein TrVFT333_009675 [Trichoderma virens FT-333]|nr:hypothetical protein TrVFT333_009675 [Trichoderma virens FT-333]
MSSHNHSTHKPGENSQTIDSNAEPPTSDPEQISEKYNYSMMRFLSHSQTTEERSPLCFRNAESEEEARARARTHLNAFDVQFGSSNK